VPGAAAETVQFFGRLNAPRGVLAVPRPHR